jgi:hypothetical protein
MGLRKLSLTQRRWLLTLHLLFSAILFGLSVVFLILSITAANTKDEGMLKACYTSMHVLAKTSLKASAIGVLVIGMNYWTLKAVTLTSAEGLSAVQDSAFKVNSGQLWTGIILQLISLAAMFVISVFKPWGSRNREPGKILHE